MKFDQVIKHNKINIFVEKNTENEIGRPVSDHFLLFKKASLKV